MPRIRYHKKTAENDDNFETEAFLSFNKNEEKQESNDSDVSLEGSDDEAENSDEDLLDDDSDAPESVTFQKSKESAVQQFREAIRQVDSDRQRKKEKRKHLQETFKKQKAEKLKNLAAARLPDEFLEEIEKEIPKKKKKVEEAVETHNEKQDSEEIITEEDRLGFSSEDDDFIPLSGHRSGRVQAVTLKEKKRAQALSETAANFRHSRLYGGSINRETTKAQLLKKEKKKVQYR